MKNLIKKNPRYSKRINYDALRDLFDGAGPMGVPVEEQKFDMSREMYTMDPEKEDEMGVVVEEGGGGVGMQPVLGKSVTNEAEGADEDGEGEVDDDMYADLGGKGDDYGGEWDAYEQEV